MTTTLLPSTACDCLLCYLELAVSIEGCDNTLRLTALWCALDPVELRGIPDWLRRRGGYCDCEVLSNVFGWERARGEPPSLRCDVVLEGDDGDPDDCDCCCDLPDCCG